MSLSKPYRYYQEEADNAIYEELLINNKCIVKMFCGTGKSLIMRNCKIIKNKKLVVFVFPSLSLITQFYEEYLNDYPKENMLIISSLNDHESTTESNQITHFLSKQTNKIICVTYQSFETLLDNLKDTKINVCLFDEAHHAVGETYQKLIFENDICEKQIFFTATPKNANGIIMYDRENINSGMCGKLVYDYSYLRGINEEYLNPFEIRIDMYTENTNKSVFECIARTILTTDNNRVLTFHSDVNTDRDTSVKNFVNEPEFKECFDKVLKNEFPEKLNKYKKNKIKMVGFYSEITPKQRAKILEQFDKTPDDEIIIISSCETMGEGIDTKRANMCVFVDPKSSFVKIIQNIGRVVRPQTKISTILIPCWVDKNKYLECNGDKEKCDEIIRQDMNQGGNFNGILNVLSALKQEDEDLYDICLHYTDTFSLKEIQSNLEKKEVSHRKILNEEVYNEEVYNQENSKQLNLKKININVHTNPDVKVLWNITNDFDITTNICSCVIDCEIIDNWFKNFEDLKNFIDENKERPSKHSKDLTEKKLGVWVTTQLRNYKNKTEGMKDETRYNLWTKFQNEYKEYLLSGDEIWNNNFIELKKFIDTHKRRPSMTLKDLTENNIARWAETNLNNYKNKTQGMKDEIRYNLWTEFLEEYKEYLLSRDEIWDNNFIELKEFIDKNKKRPIKESKILTEKQIGSWLSNQLKNYKNKIEGMKDESRHNLWTQFQNEYKQYFISADEIWNNNFIELKNFIDAHKRRPSESSKELTEKKIGSWLSNQLNKYKNKTSYMKDKSIYNLWTQFQNEYKQYFVSYHEIWNNNFIELKKFIDTNKINPSICSTNITEKKLGHWLYCQIHNYNNKTEGMKDEIRYNLWTQFLEEYKQYVLSGDEIWNNNFIELKKFIDTHKKRPSSKHLTDLTEKNLGVWLSSQIHNYKNKKKGMKDESRYNLWTQFLEEYKQYFNNLITQSIETTLNSSENLSFIIKKDKEEIEEETDITEEDFLSSLKKKKSMKLPKTNKSKVESNEQKQTRVKSEMSQLHQRYKTLKSENLKKEFDDNPELWHKYHTISEENEKSFPNQDIPRNRIIRELDELKYKKTKYVVDMGCGKAQISQYFNNDKRFEFINYDHISSNDTIISCDISKIPLEDNDVDICILSLAMWGSNCEEYIQEASRILESNGLLYIIEPTKRWSDKDENGNIIEGKEGSKLTNLLEKNGFQIKKQSVEKFCLFVCIKV